MVLLGDEALALGALHAGLSAGFGYPGTPSTEILEFLIDNYQKNKDSAPVAQWCANEKTAYESALGASFVGKRTLITMKHVGLNVAADSFMNSSLVGINGGLVLIVADDPSMHSSQGEQDSRFYADFAMVPCFEPATQQEAYEMAFDAFDISEKYHVPVLIRMVTRLAHSRAVIHAKGDITDIIRVQNKLSKANRSDWMLLPALARKNYEKMLNKQSDMSKWSTSGKWNPLELNAKRTDLAIITSGLGRNYYLENKADFASLCKEHFPGKGLPSTLHIGTMPLPLDSIRTLAQTAETLLVIEEGMPFIEKQLCGILPQKNVIIGKLTGHLPRTGELNPDSVRRALGLEPNGSAAAVLAENNGGKAVELPNRPPQLCKGCPHGDSYAAINKAVEAVGGEVFVAADIGCYALGATPPYNAVETIVCMGASIGMARGASEAGYKYTIGVIGDSTFIHSGITNLIDAVASKTPVTIIILDNSIVAMTGCQQTIVQSSQIEPLVRGLGVESAHIKVIPTTPAVQDANAKIIQEELEYRGVSVIIMVRECLEAFRLRNKNKK